jgi:hypothetical protein
VEQDPPRATKERIEMVNFRNLADKAKQTVEKRGGTDSLKRDAEELKGIATGPGSLSDKAKAAVSALKEPGARHGGEAAERAAGSAEAPTAPPPQGEAGKPTPKQAAGKAKADAARKADKPAGGKRPDEEVGGSK